MNRFLKEHVKLYATFTNFEQVMGTKKMIMIMDGHCSIVSPWLENYLVQIHLNFIRHRLHIND